MTMSNRDVISMAIRNLLKRKMRSFLTIFGVVVGTAAIVVMISLGISMENTFNEQLKQMGDITMVTVSRPYNENPAETTAKLDNNAIVRFQALPGVIAATPMVESYMYAKSGRFITSVNVLGVLPEAMEALGYKVAEGRLLQEGDMQQIVFGSEAIYSFYKENNNNRWYDNGQTEGERVPDVDVLKDRITYSFDYRYIYPQPGSNSGGEIKTYKFETVGLLEKKDDYRSDYYIFMPLKQVEKIAADQQRFNQQQMQDYGYGARAPGQQQNSEGYQNAYVKCSDLESVKTVRDAIEEMGFPAYIPSQELESMENVSQSLQTLFGAIGAVALFVAALGIMNTMIMSIYERTREIGVMKVIGALLSDIRKLFLLEAALIGFVGGVIGVALSFLLSLILNSSNLSFMNQDYIMAEQSAVSTITPWLCGVALVFATSVGLISGYFPARRAMRISALTAIKTE
jgi:ABC-type antimicrobial peptide transport system permease subunit